MEIKRNLNWLFALLEFFLIQFQSPMEIKRNLNGIAMVKRLTIKEQVSISYGDKEKFERLSN